MKRTLVNLCILCILVTGKVNAQELPSEINVIPPSPDVMAINKYTEIPVGHYTGTPNISIPLYQIQMQQLSLPISLNYHASGLKVEEHAGWVGAGWTLSAGGVISRTVRGLPDEYLPGMSTTTEGRKGFFFNNKLFLANGRINGDWLTNTACDGLNHIVTPGDPASTLDSLAQGYLDTEPDLYTFNTPAGSGKFVFNRSGDVLRFSKDDVKITDHPFDEPTFPILGSSPSTTDYQWTIQAPNGIQYKFKHAERTTTQGVCGSSFSAYQNPITGHESAWYLDEINLNGEWIKFEYTEEFIHYDLRISSSGSFKVGGTGSAGDTFTTCLNTSTVTKQRLSRITTSDGTEIKFIANTARADLSSSKRLDRIEVRKNTQPVKFYDLSYLYFGSNTKLKLTGVQQKDSLGDSIPGYEFEYYESSGFPAIDSKSQDYWGFYNGRNQSSLIPLFKNDYHHVNRTSTVNREPSASSAKVGTLKKIKYPTGGTTTFDYELHSYYDASYKRTYIHRVSAQGTSSSPDTQTFDFTVAQNASATLTITGGLAFGSYAQLRNASGSIVSLPVIGTRRQLNAGTYQLFATNDNGQTNSIKIEYEQVEAGNVPAGGLRIKQMTFTDPVSGSTTKKSFDYTLEDSPNSSGKLFAPVILGGNLSMHTHGEVIGFLGTACSQQSTVQKVSIRSTSQLPSTVYHGSHIGYSRIREYDGSVGYGNGATDYEFINEVPLHNLGYPFVPTRDLGHKNGKLLKRTNYKYSANGLQPVRQVEHVYNEQTYLQEEVEGMAFAQKNTSVCYTCEAGDYSYNLYKFNPVWHYLDKKIERLYENNLPTQTITRNYGYSTASVKPHYMHLSEAWTDSKGQNVQRLLTRDSNFPARVTRVEKELDNTQVDGTEVTYHGILPMKMKRWRHDTDQYETNVEYIFDGNNVISQLLFSDINHHGRTAFLWGYGKDYPVAKIEGMSHAEVEQLVGSTTIDNINSSSSNTFLETQLNSIRNQLPNGFLMTIYLYKGWGGLSKQIAPNGLFTSYEYDTFNRLFTVRDKEDKILKMNEYAYQVNAGTTGN